MLTRRPRTWAAVFVVMVFALVVIKHNPRQRYLQSASSHFKGSHGGSPFFGDEEDAALAPDAHRLPSADSFLLHFQAVLQQPGITMAGAKRGCAKWPPPNTTAVDYQFPADADWVLRDRDDDELAARRNAWHEFVRTGMIPYSSVASRFNGRGIAVVAGNHDTIQRLKVVLRALKRMGSQVEVEVHYWRDEMTPDIQKSLQEEHGMFGKLHFNDLSGSHNPVRTTKDGLLINFQLKTAAVLNSRFAEVLLLDSDNIPVLDPADLWGSDAYREFGSVFWPDIARTRPQNPMWAISNTPCATHQEYEQESGQLLVDKSRFWYHLQLAAWWSDTTSGNGEYYSGFILGDKDLFRFAWHALRTKFGKPRKWLASVGTLNDGFYCGHSFAQHHPDDGRVAFLHGGLLKTASEEVMRWNRDEKGGVFRHYKQAPTDEDPGVSVDVGIKFDGADYMPGHSPAFHAAMCTDMNGVEARDVNELVPFCETLFREIGGYWQLDSPA